MNIAMILNKIRPGAVWSMNNNQYEKLEWFDKNSSKPSYTEVEEAWPEVEAGLENEKTKGLRRDAYQLESDPLFFEYQRGDIEKQVWLDKVQEIKDRYPYTGFSQE
jgi:hypothetical protein